MIKVVFLEQALEELREAAKWYDQQQSGVGEEFLRAVGQGRDRLLHDPSARPIASKGIYRQFVEQFPFDLLYRIGATQVEIVAVAHHSRKPGYWRGRV